MLKQYCHETKTLILLFLDGYVGDFSILRNEEIFNTKTLRHKEENLNTKKRI